MKISNILIATFVMFSLIFFTTLHFSYEAEEQYNEKIPRCIFYGKEIDSTYIYLRQEFMVDVLEMMDLMFMYHESFPFKKEYDYYVISNVFEYKSLMNFCDSSLNRTIRLQGWLRPKTTFYLEDRRLCNITRSNFLSHCEETDLTPVPCNAKNISPNISVRSPNYEPFIMPLYIKLYDACIDSEGAITDRKTGNRILHMNDGCGNIPTTIPFAGRIYLKRPVIAVAAFWSNAYYHWMGESLPRAVLFNSSNNYYYHSGRANSKYSDFLSRVYEVNSNSIVRNNVCSKQILWPIPALCGVGMPTLLPTLRATKLSINKVLRDKVNIVYIHRIEKRPRYFVQYQELIHFFSTFSNIHFITYNSDDDPIEIFSNADCIIGPHGAGFVNMMFAPNKTKIIELLYSEDTSVGFLSFALSIGMEWHGFIAEGSHSSSIQFKDSESLHYFLKRSYEICTSLHL